MDTSYIFLSKSGNEVTLINLTLGSKLVITSSTCLERITAVEINSKNNTNGVEKLDADIDKIVEHVDKSFRKITDNLNSNPLSLGN